MYSLQHPQIDESFLQLDSKVEEVTSLLSSMIKPKDETDEDATAPDIHNVEPQETLTDDNFMVTFRPNGPQDPKSLNRFTFMRQVEVDETERSKARLERERVAQHFRKLGNTNYSQGNYEYAIEMYGRAIENIKDSPILYINRSLCYIKLGNFKRAIIDCDFVLNKLDEKNLRAWLYRAMAYKSLSDEANYENCIKYVRKYHSKQLEFIDSFTAKLNNIVSI